jgi:hypothetical protein
MTAQQKFVASVGWFTLRDLPSYAEAKDAETAFRYLDTTPVVCELTTAPGVQQGDGLQYRKELARSGTYTTQGRTFEITPALLGHWVKTFAEMQAAGHTVPVPVEHTTNPEANRGQVLSVEIENNDTGGVSLFGIIEFRDEDAARLAKTAQVSVFSPAKWEDGKGREFSRPLRHVAITDYPVIPGLAPFAIVASLTFGEHIMGLRELLAKHKITVADDATDEQMMTALDAALAKAAKPADPPKPPTSAADPPTPPAKTAEELEEERRKKEAEAAPAPVSASLVKILGENRTTKLDALVHSGRISPAVRDKFAAQYCNGDALTLSLSTEAEDGFDSLVETLKLNPVALSLGEKTGAQVSTKAEENPLIADAERRAEESKQQQQ